MHIYFPLFAWPILSKISLEIKNTKTDPIISKCTGLDKKLRILGRILFGKDEQ